MYVCVCVYIYITEQKCNATLNNFKGFTELEFIYGNQSIEIHSLGPNLWISHDWAGVQPWVGLRGHSLTHLS